MTECPSGARSRRLARLTPVRVDCRQHVTAGAPVVLWEIDFDPRKSAAVDGMQRPRGGELGKRARQPLAHLTARNDRVHLIDEGKRAGGAEAGDADVLG